LSEKISFQERLERTMYWRKAKLNPSLARFENTLAKKMKENPDHEH
jgi:hypothetical protein